MSSFTISSFSFFTITATTQRLIHSLMQYRTPYNWCGEYILMSIDIHSRINQSIATECRTFWWRRPSSTGYKYHHYVQLVIYLHYWVPWLYSHRVVKPEIVHGTWPTELFCNCHHVRIFPDSSYCLYCRTSLTKADQTCSCPQMRLQHVNIL